MNTHKKILEVATDMFNEMSDSSDTEVYEAVSKIVNVPIEKIREICER
jgi:hypothetical protein